MRLNPIECYTRIFIVPVTLFLVAGCAGDDVAPSVLATVPANGDRAVHAGMAELSVTFSEEMQDGNWSWVYENEGSFPEMTGQPRYVDRLTRNVLPVRLEPNRGYVVWINGSKYKNFRDKAGNPVVPFKLTFRTAPADG